MGGTKGSHIVLDSPELLAACAGRELFFENSDGRIVLIYPLRGKVMVGTTDLEADIGSPARCTDQEVSYFFDLIAHVFPGIPVDESQIVYRFAGVRPLPAHGDTQPGFVSRDYRIESDRPANLPEVTVISLVGGKWTTFRAVAERLTDTVLDVLNLRRRVTTAGLPIGGGRDYPVGDAARRRWIAQHREGLSADRTEQLLRRYGTRATTVIDFLARTGDDPLESTGEFTAQELCFMVEHEHVVHLLDVLLRRTSSAFDGAVTRAVIEETARILGGFLGWSAQRTAEEIDEAVRVLREEHGVDLHESVVPGTRG
jgi:glycerol-3-phosphate dehydrogenase